MRTKRNNVPPDEAMRLELIVDAVKLFQRVDRMGLPPACSSRPLRELIYFLWECRDGLKKEERPAFRSVAAVGKRPGKGALVYDHAVPMRLLLDELLGLDDLTAESVREALDRHNVVVLITKAEDRRLTQKKYRSKMPDGWDAANPLARYEAAGIKLVANKRTAHS